MLGILFMEYGKPWIIVALAGISIFILLGFILDNRFFFLALMWIFLIIPLVVAFLFFFYAMQPLTSFNCIPHKVIDDDNKIRIRTDEDKEFIVNKSEFVNRKTAGDFAILFFEKKGWIGIPLHSFPSRDDLIDFLTSLQPDYSLS